MDKFNIKEIEDIIKDVNNDIWRLDREATMAAMLKQLIEDHSLLFSNLLILDELDR